MEDIYSTGYAIKHQSWNYFLLLYFLRGGFPLYLEILQYFTLILQCIRIIVGDAGFEPERDSPLRQKSGALTICYHFSCILT